MSTFDAEDLSILFCSLVGGTILLVSAFSHHPPPPPPPPKRDLISDIKNSSGIAWIGMHPDDEILATGLLALASLGYNKNVYAIALNGTYPTAFPPGAGPEDRFIDNEEYRQFLNLRDYLRWNIQDYTDQVNVAKNFLNNYFSENNIDLVITFENTHGATGHPQHTLVSQHLTQFAQELGVKLYYCLQLDPVIADTFANSVTDPLPYTDELLLDEHYVATSLGNMSLWDAKVHAFEIYASSVPLALTIVSSPEIIQNMSHREHYRIVR